MEDIYLFGFMIAGFLLIGLGVALVYWKVFKLTASQMAKSQSATEIKECFSRAGDRGNNKLLKKNFEDMQRKMGALLHQCGELCRLTVTLSKRLNEVTRELASLNDNLR